MPSLAHASEEADEVAGDTSRSRASSAASTQRGTATGSTTTTPRIAPGSEPGSSPTALSSALGAFKDEGRTTTTTMTTTAGALMEGESSPPVDTQLPPPGEPTVEELAQQFGTKGSVEPIWLDTTGLTQEEITARTNAIRSAIDARKAAEVAATFNPDDGETISDSTDSSSEEEADLADIELTPYEEAQREEERRAKRNAFLNDVLARGINKFYNLLFAPAIPTQVHPRRRLADIET